MCVLFFFSSSVTHGFKCVCCSQSESVNPLARLYIHAYFFKANRSCLFILCINSTCMSSFDFSLQTSSNKIQMWCFFGGGGEGGCSVFDYVS